MQFKPADRQKDQEGNDYLTWAIADEDYDFKVVANFKGVQMSGLAPAFRELDDLETFARILTSAIKKHKQMKPKIHAPQPQMQ